MDAPAMPFFLVLSRMWELIVFTQKAVNGEMCFIFVYNFSFQYDIIFVIPVGGRYGRQQPLLSECIALKASRM
jgi:hypothetical protein